MTLLWTPRSSKPACFEWSNFLGCQSNCVWQDEHSSLNSPLWTSLWQSTHFSAFVLYFFSLWHLSHWVSLCLPTSGNLVWRLWSMVDFFQVSSLWHFLQIGRASCRERV